MPLVRRTGAGAATPPNTQRRTRDRRGFRRSRGGVPFRHAVILFRFVGSGVRVVDLAVTFRNRCRRHLQSSHNPIPFDCRDRTEHTVRARRTLLNGRGSRTGSCASLKTEPATVSERRATARPI